MAPAEGLRDGTTSFGGLKNFCVEGIEPDKQEASALMARGPYRKVHPVAVADTIGARALYITKVLGCTSIHKPKTDSLRRFSISNWFEVQRQMDIPVTTLDALYGGGENFDFVSMDVQGAEYEVMRGGERLFDKVLGFSLEVHFSEIYEGQMLFSSVHEFCLKKGFRLIVLGCGDMDGEIVEGDCVYIKDPQLLRSKEEVLKCILFSLNWNNEAYVENMLRNISSALLSPGEKSRIRGVLRMEEKEKSVPWADGVSAKDYSDGRGYL